MTFPRVGAPSHSSLHSSPLNNANNVCGNDENVAPLLKDIIELNRQVCMKDLKITA